MRLPRVLIVDDSSLMRRILASVVQGIDGWEVVDAAGSAEEADQKIDSLRPDAVLLDIHLPGMDGLTYLTKLRQRYTAPVIVISSRAVPESSRQPAGLLDAPFEFIEKPDGCERTLDDFRRELAQRLLALVGGAGHGAHTAPASPLARPTGEPGGRFKLIAVGGSTGGVDAVTTLLSGLRGLLPPIVVVLHMPAAYTGRFAQRLGTVTGHDASEARDGEPLAFGQVRLAPGGRHVRIEKRGGVPVTRLSDDAPIGGHKPSVDALFGSTARSFERAAIGVILTGMGRDGAEGLLAMHRAGALTYGQAMESCTVYGMPKVAMDLGAVDRELPLGGLAAELMRTLRV